MKPNSVLKLKRMTWLAAGEIALMLVLLLIATHSGAKPKPQPPPASVVEVAPVEEKDIPIYGEWIGTLSGQVNADIKAQVTGYLFSRASNTIDSLDAFNIFQANLLSANNLLFSHLRVQRRLARLVSWREMRCFESIVRRSCGRSQLAASRWRKC